MFVSVISLSLEMNCPGFRQKPHKTLKRLRRHFLFVEKPFATPQSLATANPRRVSRDVNVHTPASQRAPGAGPKMTTQIVSHGSCPKLCVLIVLITAVQCYIITEDWCRDVTSQQDNCLEMDFSGTACGICL